MKQMTYSGTDRKDRQLFSLITAEARGGFACHAFRAKFIQVRRAAVTCTRSHHYTHSPARDPHPTHRRARR